MNAVTKPASVEVVNFGCRLNAYESEVMRGHAQAAGLTDTVIVNTCAVTQEAERQGRQAIRRLKRERPDARIIATGCAVQLSPDAYAAMPEVARVMGNEHKMKRESFLPENTAPVLISDIMAVRETAEHLVEGFEGRTRAFVQVQQGCDHRCTFCIIPFARGNTRSVPMGRIVDEVRALVAAGYKEVVITGVDITGYGGDLPGAPTLGQMIKRLLVAVPELPRLRLSSLDPAELDDDLLHVIGHEPRVMPHIHISVQAGDDLILKRMKRRHLRADIIAFCARIRAARRDVVFGADIIAGFPTETEEMFAQSMALVDECAVTHLHVFPYSQRPDTPAAKMPQVPGAEIKDRASRLRAKGREAMATYLQGRVGTQPSVLIEQNGQGHSEHYVPVRVAGAPQGEIVAARISAVSDGILIGNRISA
ncbi:MAG: tRNA (N(6)-L-threonylcarbamoyladenosine(37)-C(2))-methylthiotransferase MtaB [Rhodospirillaceae bacterium]|nr:tRNA (N(6)-L-threonylcarbamoyladenosine(37)-C(2))-methylthiotransferase MtaB [Rhodospirillaceae bacterium]